LPVKPAAICNAIDIVPLSAWSGRSYRWAFTIGLSGVGRIRPASGGDAVASHETAYGYCARRPAAPGNRTE
jgi:hypothetical protein